MTSEEMKEACKNCVKLTVVFTNPETGEEKKFEETGAYFFGGILTTKEDVPGYSGCSMGGASAIEINAMHKQILKTLAETTAKSPDLIAAMMDDMFDDLLSNPARNTRSKSFAEMFADMARQREDDGDDEPCDCAFCRAERGERNPIDDLFK